MLELQSTVDGAAHLLLEHLELALRYVGRLAQVQLVVIDQNPGHGQEAQLGELVQKLPNIKHLKFDEDAKFSQRFFNSLPNYCSELVGLELEQEEKPTDLKFAFKFKQLVLFYVDGELSRLDFLTAGSVHVAIDATDTSSWMYPGSVLPYHTLHREQQKQYRTVLHTKNI